VSKHFRNPDGTVTAHIASGPIHYWEDGQWKTIFHTIDTSIDGYLINMHNGFKTTYPKSSTGSIRTYLSNGMTLMEMQNMQMYYESNGQAVGNINIQSKSGKAEFNTLTYEGVYGENVDLRLTQHTSLRKMDYILKNTNSLNSAPAGAQFLVFEEKVEIPEGVVPRLEGNLINLYFNEKIVAQYQNPIITEGTSYKNKKQKSDFIVGLYDTELNDRYLKIKLKIPMNWLLSPDRSFPIEVDPTVNFSPNVTNDWTGSIETARTATSISYTVNTGNIWTADYYSSGVNFGGTNGLSNSKIYIGVYNYNYSGTSYDRQAFHSWAKFNTSSISDNSTVTSVVLYNYVEYDYALNVGINFTKITTEPIANTVANRLTEIRNGSVYNADIQDLDNGGDAWANHTLGGTANTDMQTLLSSNWFAVGYKTIRKDANDDFVRISGQAETNKPYITVNYIAGVITATSSMTAFTSCPSTASTSQSFTVSGSNMAAGITVTAPAGFEVSTDNSTWSGNGGNVTVGAAGTIASTTVYARMAAVASAPASNDIVCSSSGATSVNVAVSGSLKSSPTITTTTASSVTNSTASSGGSSLSAGSGTISAKGVCYATAAVSTNPTTSNSTTSDGTGTANFTSSLSSLSAETQYYYRAYATNECGTGYGTAANFWTLSTEPTGHSTTFTATAMSPSQIDLAFLAASTYGADGYIILMYQGASAPTSAGVTDGISPGSLSGFSPSGATLLVTVTSNSQTTYSHSTCAALTQYYYTLIPFNWNAANTETYNYRTTATIPTCTATTLNGPSSEGYYISGNIVNNGTINESSDINYLRMTGTNKTISGTGTWTGAKICIDGTISFGGSGLTSAVNVGSTISQLFVLSNSFTIYNSQTFPVTNVTNYATITGNTGSNLQVSGIWLNTSVGTQSLSNGTVTFNGTSDQSVTSAGDSFGSVTMNNTSTSGTYNGAVLQDNMTLTGTLTLTQGNIATGSYLAYINNTAAGSVSGGSTSSYVWGKLKRAVAGANTYVFPVGKTNYEEATLAFSPGYTSADITAFFTDDNTLTLPVGGLSQTGTDLTGILNKGYWSIDPSSGVGSPTYTVTVKEIGHSNGVTSAAQYTVLKRTNTPSVGAWALLGTHSNTTQSSSGGVVTAVRSALTSFSDFSIGFGGAALPIELTTFQANCSDNNTVDVTWSTASEHNTNYFRVDKSRNGSQWDVLGTIGAAGNSTYMIDYALTDQFPNPGINYYRLTQYDLDGVFETFDVQAAVCKDQQAGTALSSYPNPSSGDFNVDLQTDELEGEGVLMVSDAKGAVVYSQNINIINGTNNYIIQRFEAEPGIYYISVKSGASTVTTKHSLR